MDGKIQETHELEKISGIKRIPNKEKALYARVSSPKQKLSRQVHDLKEACPDGVIYKEQYTGATMDRPEWNKIMKMARKGQIKEIWMDELSRMGRNREDGFNEWMELYQLGVRIYFLKTPHVNTETYKESINNTIKKEFVIEDEATDEFINCIFKGLNKFMLNLAKQQIYQAFDEAADERETLSVRTSEGIKVAAMNGKQIGRKKGIPVITDKEKDAKSQIRKHYIGFGGTLTATECSRICRISRSTFYKYQKKIQDEMIESRKECEE